MQSNQVGFKSKLIQNVLIVYKNVICKVMPGNKIIQQIEQQDKSFLATIFVLIRKKFTVWEMIQSLDFVALQTEWMYTF